MHGDGEHEKFWWLVYEGMYKLVIEVEEWSHIVRSGNATGGCLL